jgi:hypothetical protein
MSTTKKYEVVMEGILRNKAHIITMNNSGLASQPISIPKFTLSIPVFTAHKHTMTLHSGFDTHTSVLGTVDMSLISSTIKLSFGDPDTSTVVFEVMSPKSALYGNDFTFSVEMEDGARREFMWVRSPDFVETVGPGTVKEDWLHMKLLDKSTSRVLALFKHHYTGWSKRGIFEIDEEARMLEGDDWDGVVVLSGLGVFEYLRQWVTIRF